MNHGVLFWIVSMVASSFVQAAAVKEGESSRPNFVFFLVDDLGYMDIGANNPSSFYETPKKVNDLRSRLHSWYEEVDAKFLRAKEGGSEPWRPQD